MTYEEPTAKVIQLSRDSDVVTLVLEISSLLSAPLAPGGLYVADKPKQEAIQLHKLKAADGNVLTFESYDHVGELPSVGTDYIFRVWWTPDQLEAVTDTSRKWSYENYPDNRDGYKDIVKRGTRGWHDMGVGSPARVTFDIIIIRSFFRNGFRDSGAAPQDLKKKLAAIDEATACR